MQAKEVSTVGLKDFYQSVVLLTLGYPLLRLEQGRGDFTVFVFEDSNGDLQNALDEYWRGETKCVAKDLIANIHELKTRMHTRL